MIAVFFGGRSCEHDISIITGLQAMSACKKKCVGVYIDGDGVWWAAECFDSVSAVRNNRFDGKKVHLRPDDSYLYHKNKRLYKVDAALLCMHGILGEDGSLQGLLEMCGIPYTGSGVMASSVGMNKIKSKETFIAAGLNVLPFVTTTRLEYNKDKTAVIKKAEALVYPVIVKPCNLGSSIGISVANDRPSLLSALDIAFEWDDVLIIEKALVDFTEVNCAVLGDSYDDEVTVSDTEQPVGWKSFLTFSDKYSGDVKSTRHKIPAAVGEEKNEIIQALAERAFRAVGCSGVARIDFMVKGEDIYVNEINTIPGSLASPLFARQMPFSGLIEKLIDIALRRKQRFDALKRTYTPTTPIIGK